MDQPTQDPWATCEECHDSGREHASREELEADPIGTWREMWRADTVAVRWFDHPCDAQPGATPDQPEWPNAWAMFGQWGVDEVPHLGMQESHRIDTNAAVDRLAQLTTPTQDAHSDNADGS